MSYICPVPKSQLLKCRYIIAPFAFACPCLVLTCLISVLSCPLFNFAELYHWLYFNSCLKVGRATELATLLDDQYFVSRITLLHSQYKVFNIEEYYVVLFTFCLFGTQFCHRAELNHINSSTIVYFISISPFSFVYPFQLNWRLYQVKWKAKTRVGGGGGFLLRTAVYLCKHFSLLLKPLCIPPVVHEQVLVPLNWKQGVSKQVLKV